MTDTIEGRALAAAAPPSTSLVNFSEGGVFGSVPAFEAAQRMARALAASTMVPTQYQNNVANCLIAIDVAARTGTPLLAVTQNLNVIHGRPSWGSSYIAGAITASGQFSALRHEWRGQEGTDAWGCRARAKDLRTGEEVNGPWVSIKMAKDEGWYSRNGSKWPTMPEVMLMHRATSFFGRMYASHILNGLPAADEVEDTVIDITPTVPRTGPPTTAADLNAAASAATAAEQPRQRRQRRVQEAEDATPAPAQPAAAETPPAPATQAAEAPATEDFF